MLSGLIIFWMDVFAASTPIIRMIKDTIKADIYSTRPCPKGCSSSAGFLANLNPTRLITEEPASAKLLTASTDIAILPVMEPITNFMPHNETFTTIPTTPLSSP